MLVAHFVNDFHPSHNFTWVISDVQLPFLDLRLKPTSDRLLTSIHYKETDTHSYLNYTCWLQTKGKKRQLHIRNESECWLIRPWVRTRDLPRGLPRDSPMLNQSHQCTVTRPWVTCGKTCDLSHDRLMSTPPFTPFIVLVSLRIIRSSSRLSVFL